MPRPIVFLGGLRPPRDDVFGPATPPLHGELHRRPVSHPARAMAVPRGLLALRTAFTGEPSYPPRTYRAPSRSAPRRSGRGNYAGGCRGRGKVSGGFFWGMVNGGVGGRGGAGIQGPSRQRSPLGPWMAGSSPAMTRGEWLWRARLYPSSSSGAGHWPVADSGIQGRLRAKRDCTIGFA